MGVFYFHRAIFSYPQLPQTHDNPSWPIARRSHHVNVVEERGEGGKTIRWKSQARKTQRKNLLSLCVTLYIIVSVTHPFKFPRCFCGYRQGKTPYLPPKVAGGERAESGVWGHVGGSGHLPVNYSKVIIQAQPIAQNCA